MTTSGCLRDSTPSTKTSPNPKSPSSHPPGTVFYDTASRCFVATDPTSDPILSPDSLFGSPSFKTPQYWSYPASSAFGASNPSSAAAPFLGIGSGPTTTTSAASGPSFSFNSSAVPSSGFTNSASSATTPHRRRKLRSFKPTTEPSAPSTTVATTDLVTAPASSSPSSGTAPSFETTDTAVSSLSFSLSKIGSVPTSSEAQPTTTLPTFGVNTTSASAPAMTTVSSIVGTQTSTLLGVFSTGNGTSSNVCTKLSTPPEMPAEIPEKTVEEDTSLRINMGLNSSCPEKYVEKGGTPPRSAEQCCPTSEAEILSSLKSLEDLVAVATAPTSSKTPTTTEAMNNETKSIIQSFLDKEYSILADENQRIKLHTALQDLIRDKFFPPDVGPIFQGMLDHLEKGIPAFQQARTKFSDDKALARQIKSTSKALLSKIRACDVLKRKYQELEVEKQRIQAEQARVLAEIEAVVEETRPIEDQLRELIQHHAVSSENNAGYQALIDLEEELWGNFKNMLKKYFV